MAVLSNSRTTSNSAAEHVADHTQIANRLNNTWVDVRADFGAVGNGTTNDAAAIQSAIDAVAATSNRGVVFFPAATYRIDTTISVPSGITLMGSRGARGLPTEDARGAVLRAGAAIDSVVYLNNSYGSSVEHLVVDGNDLATSALKMYGFQNSVSYCIVRRGLTYGVYMPGAVDGHENNILHSLIEMNQRGTGVYLEESPSLPNGDCLLLGNIMRGATVSSLHMLKGGGHQVIGNHFYGYPASELNTLNHVKVESSNNNIISGNYFDAAGGGPALHIYSINSSFYASGNKVTDNLFLCDSGLPDNTHPAIHLDGAGGGYVLRTIISDNHIRASAVNKRWTYAVKTDNNVRSTIFTGNNCRYCVALWNTRPEVVKGNVLITAADDATILHTEKAGRAVFSGDGSTTAFVIPHGLATSPRSTTVTPGSAAAAAAYHVSSDATNITVTFVAAPATGTNNVTLNWQAEI